MPLARKKRTLSPAAPATLHTALHIGASSVSIIIAERDLNGDLTPIDFLEQPAPLAQDVFGGNVVSNATTERIVAIIPSSSERYLSTWLFADLGVESDPLTDILGPAHN